MKRFLRPTAPAVLPVLCTAIVLFLAQANARTDGWYTSLREAEEVALREGKPILADFSTSWCGNCRDLERKTFPHPYVRARMDQFVKVHVDGDNNPDLVKSYGISGYPTLIAMSPGGRELNRTVGYVDASELSNDLDRAMRRYEPPAPKRSATAKVSRSKKEEKTEEVSVASASTERAASRKVTKEVASASSRRQVAKGGGYPGDEDSYGTREPNREINYYTLSEQARSETSRENERVIASASARPIVSSAVSAAVDYPASDLRTDGVSLQRDRVVRIIREESEPRSVAEASTAKPSGEESQDVSAADPGTEKSRESGDVAPVSKESDQGAKAPSRELPRPMIKVSGRDTEFSQSGPSPSSKAAAPMKPLVIGSKKTRDQDQDTVPDADSAKSASDSEQPASTTGKPSSILGTIHKLADQTPEPGEKQSEGKMAKSDEETGAKASKKDTEEKQDKPKASSQTVKASNKKSVDEAAPARKVASSDEPRRKSSSQTPSADEVAEWIRVAEGHQAAKRWKEARAMYQRVVDRDPKNVNGQTDLAFIRMCALMVTPDQADNDKVRLEAYNKIREFMDRFGNSRHMDYYTVTRADLAADLGKVDEARNLLADFPTRFPNSRYLSWARDSWDRLEKPSSTASKSKSSSSRSTAKSRN